MAIDAVGPGTGGDMGLATDGGGGGAGESREPDVDGFIRPSPGDNGDVCWAAELGRGGERDASWDDISRLSRLS